jgi:GTP-binding protein
VVINKVDRPTSRLDGSVENELFDMFVALDATDEQLDFPIIYASAKQGWACDSTEEISESGPKDLRPLLEKIVSYIPAPAGDSEAPFSMCVTMIGRDNYVGRLATGRIRSGKVKVPPPLCCYVSSPPPSW